MGLIKFPDNFFWGTATSAHQVEGGNFNDWTEWEKVTAKNKVQMAALRQAEGKGWPDYILNPPAGGPNPLQEENYISGRAADHYRRFEEDFDIAKKLGQNAHRFSIEWSRIEPEEGKFNEKEIEHYRRVIKALRERGIEPFVTLWHWTNPLWIRDIGGWESKKIIKYFLRYVRKICDSLGEEIKYWIPINEPTIYAGQAYLMGVFPPQVRSWWRANKVLKNLSRAHRQSYKIIHENFGKTVMVGSAHNFHFHKPYNKWQPFDLLAVKIFDYFRDARHLDWLESCEDFIGLNYYYADTLKFVLWGGRFGVVDVDNPGKEISDRGWEIYPEGIYHILNKLKWYNKPIYITENGLADARDEKRAKFIKEHLFWVSKAIEGGVDVRGYFHWSLVDNFEWEQGFWIKMGLVKVDYQTMGREIRPSAYEYTKICKSNALES